MPEPWIRPPEAQWTERQVAKAILRHLRPDLLHKDWGPGGKHFKPGRHKHFGYCNVASQAFYWLMGAREAGYKAMRVKHEGGTHWWVESPTGKIWDLTKEQFDTPVPYGQGQASFFPGRGYFPTNAGKRLIERVRTTLERGKRAMTLRNHLIRLAHANPELRSELLPMLRAGMEHATPEARKKYLQDHPKADPAKHSVKKPKGDGGKGDGGKGDAMRRKMIEDYRSRKEKLSPEEKSKAFREREPLSKAEKTEYWPERENFSVDEWRSLSDGDKAKLKKDREKASPFAGSGLASVMDQSGKKASTLRSKLVRLAYTHPELRDDLLPLVQDGGNR